MRLSVVCACYEYDISKQPHISRKRLLFTLFTVTRFAMHRNFISCSFAHAVLGISAHSARKHLAEQWHVKSYIFLSKNQRQHTACHTAGSAYRHNQPDLSHIHLRSVTCCQGQKTKKQKINAPVFHPPQEFSF